jgi:hypothetical protein
MFGWFTKLFKKKENVEVVVLRERVNNLEIDLLKFKRDMFEAKLAIFEAITYFVIMSCKNDKDFCATVMPKSIKAKVVKTKEVKSKKEAK